MDEGRTLQGQALRTRAIIRVQDFLHHPDQAVGTDRIPDSFLGRQGENTVIWGIRALQWEFPLL